MTNVVLYFNLFQQVDCGQKKLRTNIVQIIFIQCRQMKYKISSNANRIALLEATALAFHTAIKTQQTQNSVIGV